MRSVAARILGSGFTKPAHCAVSAAPASVQGKMLKAIDDGQLPTSGPSPGIGFALRPKTAFDSHPSLHLGSNYRSI
ncbi:hypothetical protein O181_022427 [Austropuccinia psidii MF-1]|uniref:Uncharacterized protein n=1 Tax=Austropuccinia psidii MF-1 TaxID=1389203 RepID=A0A9Q3GX42_9BASI|nr:hypothetical protein [Austropuccinia psidii MF-1]